jgi:hypothetical protein
LPLNGAEVVVDTGPISDNPIVDVEVIDITGGGDNTLTLDFQEVVNLSSHSNTLMIRRD